MDPAFKELSLQESGQKQDIHLDAIVSKEVRTESDHCTTYASSGMAGMEKDEVKDY